MCGLAVSWIDKAKAFVDLYRGLLPTLQYTLWPAPENFPYLWPDPTTRPPEKPAWPKPRVVYSQYITLLSRLKDLRRRCPERVGTAHVATVTPVVVISSLAAVCRGPFLGDCRPLSVLSRFLLRRGTIDVGCSQPTLSESWIEAVSKWAPVSILGHDEIRQGARQLQRFRSQETLVGLVAK